MLLNGFSRVSERALPQSRTVLLASENSEKAFRIRLLPVFYMLACAFRDAECVAAYREETASR